MKQSSQWKLRNGTECWNPPPLSGALAEPARTIASPGTCGSATTKVSGGVGQLWVSIWMLFLLMASGTGKAQELYEGYYSMINEYPRNGNLHWSDACQGLAHDENYWFITQRGNLWKVHVTNDLDQVSLNTPHVLRKTWGQVPALETNGFCHWGDPDQAWDYVFVPIEHTGDTGDCNCHHDIHEGVAVFSGHTLDFICWAPWPDHFRSASWCAIDGNYNLCTSGGKPTSDLHVYSVDWRGLTNPTPAIIWGSYWTNTLKDETGTQLADIWGSQGGEFSESKHVLYIVSDERIEVFDTTTWRRLKRSFNPNLDPYYSASFIYRCDRDPGGTGLEAEGVTVWDLDSHPYAPPKVKGQLHVMLANLHYPEDDHVDIKHYGSKIYVNNASSGAECPPTSDGAWPSGCGSFNYPFHTVAAALAAGGAGSRIVIRSNYYPENLVLATKMEIIATNGMVVIGGP